MVVMPDHVHAVVIIQRPVESAGPGIAVAAGRWYPLMQDTRPLLGKLIRCWKAGSTHGIRRAGWPRFRWQRSYYDRVIRDPGELEQIRRYVMLNPRRVA
jgi:REP-associated tyrosine transposase